MVKISHPYTSVRDGCDLPKAFYIYILYVVVSPSVTFQNQFRLLTCLPGKTQKIAKPHQGLRLEEY